jgi:soluble lytic murein transglycosylase
MRNVALALMVVLTLMLPACAHGGGRSQSKAANPAEANSADESRDLRKLNDVVLGLSGFEGRASNYTKDEWNFVLGYAHFMHGRPAEAEHFLKKASGKLPKLEDYILYYRASIANRTRKYSTALGFLDALDANYPDSVWYLDAKVERARALSGKGQFGEAQTLLNQALDGATGAERDRVERLIAWTYIESGDSGRATEYVKLMALAAGSDRDLEEMGPLMDEVKKRYGVDVRKWLDFPSNQLRLAESFAADSQWQDAAARLERLLSSGRLDSSMKTRAKWLLAKSYRWIHRYGDSIALMEELRRSPGGRRISGLSTTLATVYAKKNDYKKAIAIRRQILDRLPPGSRAAANMAYKIAFLYVDENRYKEAIPLLRQVASMRSSGSRRTLARWYVGWCHFMLKDYGEALVSFDELLKRGAKGAKIADRVMYWKGRALFASGMKAEARESFREVIRKYPRGYYAELARRRIEGDRRDVYDFAIAKGSWGVSRDWKPTHPGTASNVPHMGRALELDRLGLHAEVARELKACDFNSSPEAAEVGLWLAWRNFAHDIAYRLAQKKFRGTLKQSPGRDRFASFVWEQAYPRAYDPVVVRLDSNGDIDPMLVWSIMKNESAFRPQVISPAGAVGLMQLMPTTANLMSRDMGEGKVSVTDLYKPATNIAYGITYLDKLAGLFPGNAVAVIASYNAGEQAVGRWLANGTFSDIEEWIEEIPYGETNLYVKKVLNSYWRYQRLYGSQVRVAQRGAKPRASAGAGGKKTDLSR